MSVWNLIIKTMDVQLLNIFQVEIAIVLDIKWIKAYKDYVGK